MGFVVQMKIVCIDPNCAFSCFCNDSSNCNDYTLCTSVNATISHQLLIFTFALTTFQGDISINQSSLDLNGNELIFEQNLTISDSLLSFFNSSIISQGCINLRNINFTVNLKNFTSNNNKIVLFKSESGCLNIQNYNITYLNKPDCSTSNIESDGENLVINTVVINNCKSQNPANYTLIITVIVCVVVGLIIITLLIVFVTPLKYAVFPKLKIRKNLKKESQSVKKLTS